MINAWERLECMNVVVIVLKKQNKSFTKIYNLFVYLLFLFTCKPLNFSLQASYESD